MILENFEKSFGSHLSINQKNLVRKYFKTMYDEQKVAFLGILSDIFSKKEEIVLSGYAGTGKTYLTKCILDVLVSKREVKVLSFTGQMVDTLKSKGIGAQTIHSWFYVPELDENEKLIGFTYSFERATSPDNYLIEEYSNIDNEVYKDIAKSNKQRLLIGDFFQNEPVGEKNTIFKKTNYLLKEIVRYSGPLIKYATMLRNNESLPFKRFYEVLGDVVFGLTFVDLRSDWYDRLQNFEKIICGTNKTRRVLNKEMRRRKGIKSTFPMSQEPIMCLKNIRDEDGTLIIANGEELQAQKIYDDEFTINGYRFRTADLLKKSGEVHKMRFCAEVFYDNEFPISKLDEKDYSGIAIIDFSYAVTSHKYQGSEAESVIVLAHDMLFARDDSYVNMVYTAMTRAKKKCLIVMNRRQKDFDRLHFDPAKYQL